MPIISNVDVTKNVRYQAPYTGVTFKDMYIRAHNADEVLDGMFCTSDGVNATVGTGSFIQKGIVVELTSTFNVTLPGVYPRILAADNIDEADATDVDISFYDQATFDATPNLVEIARFESAYTIIHKNRASHSRMRERMFMSYVDNLAVNPSFEFDRRASGPYVATAVGEGVTGLDRWYGFIEGSGPGNVTWEQTSVAGEYVEGGSGAKVVYTIGTSTRGGIGQTLDTEVIRNRTIFFSARVRCNQANAVRLKLRDTVAGIEAISGYHPGHDGFHLMTVVLKDPGALISGMRACILSDVSATFYVDSVYIYTAENPVELTSWNEPNASQLARVHRRLNQGSVEFHGLGGSSSTQYILEGRVDYGYQRESGVGTLSTSNLVVYEDGDTVDVSGNYTFSTTPSNRGFTWRIERAHGVDTGPEDDLRPSYVTFDWEVL
jgi:hypothetical protein